MTTLNPLMYYYILEFFKQLENQYSIVKRKNTYETTKKKMRPYLEMTLTAINSQGVTAFNLIDEIKLWGDTNKPCFAKLLISGQASGSQYQMSISLYEKNILLIDHQDDSESESFDYSQCTKALLKILKKVEEYHSRCVPQNNQRSD